MPVEIPGLCRPSEGGRKTRGVHARPRFVTGRAHQSRPFGAVRSNRSSVQEVGGDVRHFVAEHFLQERFVGGVAVVEQRRVDANEAGARLAAAQRATEARAGLDAGHSGELRELPGLAPFGEPDTGFSRKRGADATLLHRYRASASDEEVDGCPENAWDRFHSCALVPRHVGRNASANPAAEPAREWTARRPRRTCCSAASPRSNPDSRERPRSAASAVPAADRRIRDNSTKANPPDAARVPHPRGSGGCNA